MLLAYLDMYAMNLEYTWIHVYTEANLQKGYVLQDLTLCLISVW